MFHLISFIMSNLLKAPRHEAHLARSSFSMGQSFTYTASTGMILPLYSDLLNVGESVYLNSSLMVRTQPLVTAALCDIHINVDWFFVPISKLFTLFPSLRYQTNDPISDFFNVDANNPAVNGRLPLFNLDKHLYCTGQLSAPGTTYYEKGLGERFGAQSLNCFRLADMLGYNPMAAFTPQTSSNVINPKVFPWRALAYQCIYQEHFRNDMYERKNTKSYNVDSLYASESADETYFFRDLFYLRFCQRHKDYFNIVRPQPYLSAINLIGDTSVDEPSYDLTPFSSLIGRIESDLAGSVPRARDNSFKNAVIPAGQLGDVNSDANSFTTTSFTNSTSDLRVSFAAEKLLRIIGMSKKDYDSQVLAHFGFKVPHDVKHEITHIDNQHGIMHIGEVISTADTYDGSNGSALGQVGGKGYGIINFRKKMKKFTAPVDGVLMAVSTLVSDNTYIGGFDKQNAVAYMDNFFTPEFDKLGAEPMFAYETAYLPSSSDKYSKRLGWNYRYQQWKMKYNRASMAFYAPIPGDEGVNVYSPWVASQRPLGFDNDSFFPRPTFQNFLCTPHDIDNIMVVPYNGKYSNEMQNTPWLLYQTDPFICNFVADVKKLSTMSPTGDPDLTSL